MHSQLEVQLLDMVDNSISHCEHISGSFSPFDNSGRLLHLVDLRVPPLLSSSPPRPLPFREVSSRFIHAHRLKHGTHGNGRESTSCTVHRRVVFPLP